MGRKMKMMHILSWIAIIVFLPLSLAFSDVHERTRIPVIVDTDVALDDVRALALLVQSDDIDLIAVVTSDGACTPYRGALNIHRVLHFLGKSDIPVAAGRRLDKPPPPWRPMSETLGWSEFRKVDTDISDLTAEKLIAQKINESKSKIVYLCLGPMTNLSDAFQADSLLIERINTVYYSGIPPDIIDHSWNTARDIEAARKVFNINIPIRGVSLHDDNLMIFGAELYERIRKFNTHVAQMIIQLHSHEKVFQLVEKGHFYCWDEMVVLSFLAPNLFTYQPMDGSPNVQISTGCQTDNIRYQYLSLLSGDLSVKRGHREAVVLEQYPTLSNQLREDIRPLKSEIIEKHGLAEWNAALITSELHRHLGVYSIIGVKMGIRAREILDAGVDELQVISHAGTEPPLSCMTDGLQVATGASLGHGTISVYPDTSIPEALFIKESKKLTLRLNDDVLEQIKADFQNTIEQYGMLTPEYWEAIRKLALQYWLELDRRGIFHEALSSEDSYNVK